MSDVSTIFLVQKMLGTHHVSFVIHRNRSVMQNMSASWRQLRFEENLNPSWGIVTGTYRVDGLQRLVRQAYGIEVALVGQVPAAIPEVVDGGARDHGPGAVGLAEEVHARGVVVRGLEVLGLEHVVLVGVLDLLQCDLLRGAADTESGLGSDAAAGGEAARGEAAGGARAVGPLGREARGAAAAATTHQSRVVAHGSTGGKTRNMAHRVLGVLRVLGVTTALVHIMRVRAMARTLVLGAHSLAHGDRRTGRKRAATGGRGERERLFLNISLSMIL